MNTCSSPYIIQYFGSVLDKDPEPFEGSPSFGLKVRDRSITDPPSFSGLALKARKRVRVHIMMEYCELGSAKEVMRARKRAYSEDQIVCLCRNILKGLNYLHSNKKIHRDIKSDNILINGDGEAKLGFEIFVSIIDSTDLFTS